MRVMMFEDAEKAPISQLIARAYGKQLSVVLYFTGGNSILRDKLCEIYREEDQYIIYIDLVPDNYTTIKEYRMLRNTVRRRKFKNVYILPIICIEYYVMKAFYYKTQAVEAAVQCGDYREYSSQSSLERYCKYVLNTEYPLCMHTGQEYDSDSEFGGFYRQDCLCAKPLKKCNEFRLVNKARELIRKFPAFYKPDDWTDNWIKSVDLESVHDELIAEFKEIANKYDALGLIDVTVKDYRIE